MALTVAKAKLKTSFDYTPISQIGEVDPFSVKFDAIPLDTLAELQDAALSVNQTTGEYSVSINTLNYAVIKLALVGWSNIESDEGPVRFKRDNKGATDGTLALIPAEIRSELATIIVEVSKDLPNAENYLAELAKLASEDEDEDEVVKPKSVRKPRAKKA